jgi:hypothetical protein
MSRHTAQSEEWARERKSELVILIDSKREIEQEGEDGEGNQAKKDRWGGEFATFGENQHGGILI